MGKILFVLWFFVCFFGLSAGSAFSSPELEERLRQLEEKVYDLERKQIVGCRLNSFYRGTRLRECLRDQFIGSITMLGERTPVQVRCYEYRLECRDSDGRKVDVRFD